MKKYSIEWWQSLPPEKVGKETEAMVEKLFKEWNGRSDFAWHRLPDAKAARGVLKAQPADYIYRFRSCAGFLEVKALKHEYRLPADRLTQLPTLNKWSMAGSFDLVLVHHYMIGAWRIVSPSMLAPGAPSWDLSRLTTHASAAEALAASGCFPEVSG